MVKLFGLNLTKDLKFNWTGVQCNDPIITTTGDPNSNQQVTLSRLVNATRTPCNQTTGNPCSNNGLCSFNVAGEVTCFCPTGFSGNF